MGKKPDPCPTRGISPRGRKSPATCYCPGVCAICGFTRHMAIHESEAETPEGPFGMHRFREQNDAARAAQGASDATN